VNMGEIPMPGGWMLSTAWVPMCGQTWLGAAASFVAMWALMMAAMMLPSLVPTLWRHGFARGALAGTGYFAVWTALGAFVFVGGATVAQVAILMPALARAVPVVAGLVVLLGGAFQFTDWKAQHLACCRSAAQGDTQAVATTGSAWRSGVRLGLHCSRACAGFTAILLVIGVMEARAMAVLTVAITAERLVPSGRRVVWGVGALAIAAGTYLTGRAAGML
jgi:predicted metal-binding membrane protein